MSTTPALQHRLEELDWEIAKARTAYERTSARVASQEYIGAMLEALGRIADLLVTDKTERPDLQALIAVGRITEIVAPFNADRAVIDHYERLKEQRQRLERRE